nr:dCTP pyrophosphatase 1 [Pogona vitticeps]XP_020669188.1 dCTP pyrophosphatase 1 [Pogona vitticeps]XP_020669190.1 dCTP pyrophosphatase 1 [Pogona vitticeps]
MASLKEGSSQEQYCKGWEEDKDLKSWLQPVPGDEGKAACGSCACELPADHAHLQQHMATAEHQTSTTPACSQPLADGGLIVSKSSGPADATEAFCSSPDSLKTKEEDKAMMANGLGKPAGAFRFSAEPTLEDIRSLQSAFTQERGWGRYHQPRNLLLALVGEVGELAELFQWREEAPEGLPGWTVSEREALSDELSDVLIYLVALADKCHVDLPAAALRKIDKNRLKYPAEKVYGSSKKYTEYQN